jgi:hypothetical protein
MRPSGLLAGVSYNLPRFAGIKPACKKEGNERNQGSYALWTKK